jgi:hypothetical protein
MKVTGNGTTVADWDGAKRWLLGLGATWIVLTFMVDTEDLAELAAAIAAVMAGTTLLTYGPDALRNLGFLQ